LGQDVFKKGKISVETINMFVKLMRTFKLLIELYEVEHYKAVATSAMREASNGDEIKQLVASIVELEIEIITGDTEAGILSKAIIPYLKEGQSIHIDVGGGSTELNVYQGKTLKLSKSFKLGSVRKLSKAKRVKTFAEIKQWIQKAKLHKTKNIIGIGTGGNINKLFKLANKSQNNTISLAELKGLRAYVEEFSVEERQSILKMNPDRADVIVPASEIYIEVLKSVGSDSILVPKIGLKDGLIYEIFESVTKRNIEQIEYLEEF